MKGREGSLFSSLPSRLSNSEFFNHFGCGWWYELEYSPPLFTHQPALEQRLKSSPEQLLTCQSRKHATNDEQLGSATGGLRSQCERSSLDCTITHWGLPPGGPWGAGVNEKVKVLGRCGGSQSLVGRGVGTACWTYWGDTAAAPAVHP